MVQDLRTFDRPNDYFAAAIALWDPRERMMAPLFEGQEGEADDEPTSPAVMDDALTSKRLKTEGGDNEHFALDLK